MLTIDLTAIQANWLKLRTLGNGASIAGVIKANAYGLGAARVGNALYDVGCRAFFLASIDEALAARDYLPPSATIYMLGGMNSGDESDLISAGVIPVLCSQQSIRCWANANATLGTKSPCAIKINTGMTRFGLDIPEFESLCADTKLLQAINPTLCMSHLACADEQDHRLNVLQRDKFARCAGLIKSVLPGIHLSLANSSGIFLGCAWHFDLLRPGAGLYGINPVPGKPNPMRGVVHLSLPIMQIRKLDESAAVGYGASAVLPKGSRLAVVKGGYADGLHRSLGLQPEGILCGQHIRAVGRVSMDSTVFDISAIDLPDDLLMREQIEVISDRLSVDYLAQKNRALGYEVLTSLGARYERSYVASSL
ncbi:MAG TPA: alanine racemase [Cellvibrio sp.]|nr:alanine racemase [Cellvibrio sp.]